MRIRKNARFSSFLHTNYTNLSNDEKCELQNNTNISCELNQNPWDIPSFDSFYQVTDNEVYYNGNSSGNGSSIDYVNDLKSMVSVKTFEGVNNDINDAKNDCDGVLAFKDTEKSEIREEIMLCGKIDEEGWQCGKVVKNGESVCENHMIELKTVQAVKKEAQPVHGSLGGSGPPHSKKRVLANPYDQVYYYSGFGPNWGKKRGSGSSISNKYNEPTKIVWEENKIKETSSADEDKVNIGKGEENMYEPEASEVGPPKLKYDDDDDDYNHKKGKTGITGKKRRGKAMKVRKAMKARSFKSLI